MTWVLSWNGSSETRIMKEMETWLSDSRVVTIVRLTTEADDKSSPLHNCVDRCNVWPYCIGRRDASRGGGCSKTSAYTGQFGWASMIRSTLSDAALRCREGDATLLSTGSHESCIGCRQPKIPFGQATLKHNASSPTSRVFWQSYRFPICNELFSVSVFNRCFISSHKILIGSSTNIMKITKCK